MDDQFLFRRAEQIRQEIAACLRRSAELKETARRILARSVEQRRLLLSRLRKLRSELEP